MSHPVLLVHGGGLGPWEWDLVRAELDGRGIRSETVELATRQESGTVADDERVVREALAALGEPAVLVGHSYSGIVITAASAGNDDVAHLVYTCALMPAEGQSGMDVFGLGPAAEPGEPIAPIDGEPEQATGFRNQAANDTTDEQWRWIRPQLGGMASSAIATPIAAAGWREHPSTYVVTTLDRLVSPALQRTLAAQATTVEEVEAGHMPTVTQPTRLAEIIAAAAA
jgi:pimeloyl-ACP methyl ester carboxylesterase